MVLYIRKDISHEINVIEIDRINFLVADLSINENDNLRISATYRSHDIPKTEYVLSTKKFLIENRKVKNRISEPLLVSNFLAHEYFPCFTDVTRLSTIGHGGTCIDNVFIKSSTINIVSYKIANPFNDHFPLFVNYNNVKLSSNDNNRINERINYDKLTKIANDVDWNSILTIQEPNSATDELITKINKCVEISICVNKQKRREIKHQEKKWITKAIIVSCKKRNYYIIVAKKYSLKI